MSKLLSRRDLDFLLYEWLGAESLTTRERFADHSRETFDAFLDVSQQIAERDFAPHNRAGDLTEPTFDGEKVTIIPEVSRALRVFAESGLIAASMDAEHGGLQRANGDTFARANESGAPDGCHLHLEMWSAPGWYEGGSPFDPLPSLQAWDSWS